MHHLFFYFIRELKEISRKNSIFGLRNIKLKLVLELGPMAHKPFLFLSSSLSLANSEEKKDQARFQWRRFWVICLPSILTISVNIVPPTLLIPLLVLPQFSSSIFLSSNSSTLVWKFQMSYDSALSEFVWELFLYRSEFGLLWSYWKKCVLCWSNFDNSNCSKRSNSNVYLGLLVYLIWSKSSMFSSILLLDLVRNLEKSSHFWQIYWS